MQIRLYSCQSFVTTLGSPVQHVSVEFGNRKINQGYCCLTWDQRIAFSGSAHPAAYDGDTGHEVVLHFPARPDKEDKIEIAYSNSLFDLFLPPVQVAAALSALESVAGAVRVNRFDHSSLDSLDSTTVNTDLFNMEYIVHFYGLARPADLSALTYTVDSDGDCGETMVPNCSRLLILYCRGAGCSSKLWRCKHSCRVKITNRHTCFTSPSASLRRSIHRCNNQVPCHRLAERVFLNERGDAGLFTRFLCSPVTDFTVQPP